VNRGRVLWVGFLLALVMARASGAGPMPVIFQSAPGRFEVAAIDATAAQAVVTRAEEAWRWLEAPLALPDAFSSPIFVRLVPVADWRDAGEFRVVAEAGGVVSVRLCWGAVVPEAVVRRALVQALLMRIAVAHHGASERLTVSRWLEEACVGWWQTHTDPSQLDALKQETARLAPPALADLLAWQRGDKGTRELEVGAVWLLVFFQEESGRTGAWPKLLDQLLGGAEPVPALKASFVGRGANAAENELWWETGWHHARQVRTLPTLEAAESRAGLAELARFVVAADDHDSIAPLRVVLAHQNENATDSELKRRAAALGRLLPTLHPFYRNAGLSLAEVLGARAVSAEQGDALCAAFERDWRDATEVETASAAALDALERGRTTSTSR
jgi:hypothetical protein